MPETGGQRPYTGRVIFLVRRIRIDIRSRFELEPGPLSEFDNMCLGDIARLFPKKVDKQRLVELMTIVKSSTARNKKAARLEQNISHLGGAVVKLLDLLA